MTSCAHPGCAKPKRLRGRWCQMHAARVSKHGSPDVTSRLVGVPVLERLMLRVRGGDVTTCWLWQGALSSSGYGVLKVDGQARGVHRIAYEEFVTPIPTGLDLDHLCRQRLCVNPWHLQPVTKAENNRRKPAVA